jgi:hypothetical protein
MSIFPNELKKIKQRIKKYEKDLNNEQKTFGSIHDGAGKRYLLGPLYMMAGDVKGALKSFAWFQRNFSDDIGEPFHSLTWTLALYRSGDKETASQKLIQTMFKNLYLVPHLLGQKQNELDIWHGSNLEALDYVQEAPSEYFNLWDDESRMWVRTLYESSSFTKIRNRYVDILRELKNESPGPRRSQLVKEARDMEELNFEGL